MDRMLKKCVIFLGLFLFCHSVSAAPERIISASHSVTELLLALGGEKKLIAVDQATRLPATVDGLPVVGYYRQLSTEGLLAQRPQLLIGSAQMGPVNVIDQVRSAGVRIEQIPEAQTGEQLLNNIDQLASIIEKPAQGLKQSVRDTLQRLAVDRQKISQPPRILFVRAQQGRGFKAAGVATSPNSLIELTGGVNAATFSGYKALSGEALLQLQPDWIWFASGQAQALNNGAELLNWQPLLKFTRAGKTQQFLAIDDYALLGGIGPTSLKEAQKITQLLVSRENAATR
ncbi:MAG: ABC transporter substrate-binding protein [Gammaproteobacteria bacterium]|nr:ABC transporter substrate-binding protein [Gammaproteobacteria bacterium]